MIQNIEEWYLAFEDVLPGVEDGEPCSAIYFGEFNEPPGMRRPLYLAKIAGECGRIAISFEAPCLHDLASGLFDRAERLRSSGYGEAGFFLELPDGGREGRLALVIFAFGDGPRSKVFPGPEGATRMDEEDF